MRSGSGNAKGGEFERHICKLLSQWVTGGARTDVFWRTSMSGGRATVARKRGEELRQSGDIASVAPEGHHLTSRLYFELKFYKDLELMNFFVKQKGTLAKFWIKTVEEADSYSKTPVLIVKQNRVPTLLLTTCGEYCQELESFIAHPVPLMEARVSVVHYPESICTVYRLDDILALPYRKPSKRVRI